MAQYIDKDALIAEINRVVNSYDPTNEITSGRYTLVRLRNFIDTLDVKEVDLKNSMVCKVDWYDGFLLDYTQKQQDELLKKIGADVGDKIRVILIKE